MEYPEVTPEGRSIWMMLQVQLIENSGEIRDIMIFLRNIDDARKKEEENRQILEDALYLASICSKVYLIHRRDTFRAEKSLIDQVMAAENIECVMESRVTALIGEKKLTELEVTNLSGEKKTLVADGLFVAIGMEPHNEVFRDLVDLDEAGYVIAGENCKTRTPGVYAAGDCRTKTVRQLTTAAADGTVCGLVCKAV